MGTPTNMGMRALAGQKTLAKLTLPLDQTCIAHCLSLQMQCKSAVLNVTYEHAWCSGDIPLSLWSITVLALTCLSSISSRTVRRSPALQAVSSCRSISLLDIADDTPATSTHIWFILWQEQSVRIQVDEEISARAIFKGIDRSWIPDGKCNEWHHFLLAFIKPPPPPPPGETENYILSRKNERINLINLSSRTCYGQNSDTNR